MKKDNEPPAATPAITINDISMLIVSVKEHLEKKTKETLFARIFDKDKPEPFWRIAKDEEMHGIACTVHYHPLKKELSFWCTHENCKNTNIYSELGRKLKESAQKLGLSIEDLNPINN